MVWDDDSWTFWALIIMSAYTANLASFLVSRNMVEYSVSTLEDALKQGTPVCIQRFSVMDDIVTKNYPEMNIVRKETEQGIVDGLRRDWYGGNQGCGVALTNLGTFQLYQGRQDVNPDCTLTTEKREVRQLPSGFATAVDTGGRMLLLDFFWPSVVNHSCLTASMCSFCIIG
jgi:hypothetical protein